MLPSAATKRDGSPVYDVSTWLLLQQRPCPRARRGTPRPRRPARSRRCCRCPATLWKSQSGLPQKKICGFLAYQASTAFGRLGRRLPDLLVGADHRRAGCCRPEYICAETVLEADRRSTSADLGVHAGVAERPRVGVLVGVDRAVRPISWYRRPWSGSGHQLVWITTLSGQMPLRLPAAGGDVSGRGRARRRRQRRNGETAGGAADGDAAAAGDAAGATDGEAAGGATQQQATRHRRGRWLARPAQLSAPRPAPRAGRQPDCQRYRDNAAAGN